MERHEVLASHLLVYVEPAIVACVAGDLHERLDVAHARHDALRIHAGNAFVRDAGQQRGGSPRRNWVIWE